MMNRIRLSRPMILGVTAAILSACNSAQQAPAPVVSGVDNSSYGVNSAPYTPSVNTAPYTPSVNNNTTYTPSTTVNNNPYANPVPYTPNSAPVATVPTTVPVTTSPTVVNTPSIAPAPSATSAPSGTYIPSYAPVDINATYHQVVQGDTVYNISKRYGISQDQLRQWNQLSGDTISKGQSLRVKPQTSSSNTVTTATQQPKVTSPAPAPASVQTPATPAPAVNSQAISHRVVAGDTLYNISKRYGVSQEQLRQWNQINGDNVQLGQVLHLRASNPPVAANPPAVVAQPAPVVKTTPAPAPVSTPKPAPIAQQPAPSTPTVVAPAPKPTTVATAPKSTVRTNSKGGVTWQTPLLNAKVSQAFKSGQTRGIQLNGGEGKNVMAAADGQVIYTGPMKNHGTIVIVQHSGKYLTAYGQLQNTFVKDKQNVQRGQTLATTSSQPLHFELRQEGVPQDPAQYIVF